MEKDTKKLDDIHKKYWEVNNWRQKLWELDAVFKEDLVDIARNHIWDFEAMELSNYLKRKLQKMENLRAKIKNYFDDFSDDFDIDDFMYGIKK